MRLEDAEDTGGLGRGGGRRRGQRQLRRGAAPGRDRRARSGRRRAGPCCCGRSCAWSRRRPLASRRAGGPVRLWLPLMRSARCCVAVEHVPHPGDRGLALDDFGGEIAAHAIGRRAFARDHREPARLRLVVEIPHQGLELRGRRAVDGVEGDGGAARLRRPPGSAGLRTGKRRASNAQASRQQHSGPTPTKRRATRAAAPTPLHGHPSADFCYSPPAGRKRSGSSGAESSKQAARRAALRKTIQAASAMALMWRP